MTVSEFKQQHSKLAHLEGNDLWDAMTEAKLREQDAEETLRVAIPFFRRYTLRWLFYRRVPNYRTDKYLAERCKHCKDGSNKRYCFAILDFETQKMKHIHSCGKPFDKEPNTNLNYRIWNITNPIKLFFVDGFWSILSAFRIVRSCDTGRYEMFGDEARYVLIWSMNTETHKMSYTLKKRIWWEYIFIENPNLNI